MVDDRSRKAVGFGIAKLFLFGAELFLLLVFCNGVFLVPEPYFGKRGLYTAIAALVAVGCALAGGRISLATPGLGKSSRKTMFTTFPVLFCFVILSLAAFIFALALLGKR